MLFCTLLVAGIALFVALCGDAAVHPCHGFGPPPRD